jgi:hypothetical protein
MVHHNMKTDCKHCTLYRECIDGVCEECRGNTTTHWHTSTHDPGRSVWTFEKMQACIDTGAPPDRIAIDPYAGLTR